MRAINFYGNLSRWNFVLKQYNTQKLNARNLKTRKLNFLQEKLDVLDNEICHGNGLFNQSLLDEYESIKTELKDIYEKRGQEAMFRSKARWVEKGEKPTKTFFQFRKAKL